MKCKIHHFTLSVADLERPIFFYCQIIGFKIVEKYAWNAEGNFIDQALGKKSASGKGVMISSGNAFIELFQYKNPEFISHLKHPTHLCIYTDDIDALYQKVCSYSATTPHPPKDTHLGTLLAFVNDPDENLIELLQICNDDDALNFNLIA